MGTNRTATQLDKAVSLKSFNIKWEFHQDKNNLRKKSDLYGIQIKIIHTCKSVLILLLRTW